ncbi:MAG: nucleotide exchange factor GrpE [Clostridia bacterium]|nr:nucleotide exchange factor GrpE [Clostridia bacterium]MBR6604221.1 nucleotide exchange factor GrpE [Clostridia bacterium]
MAEKKMTDEKLDEIIEELEIDEKEAEEKSEKKKAKKGCDGALKKELEETKKALEDAQKALEDSNNKYLTMLAEYDNFRKRSAAEKERTYTDAKSDALMQILPVIDNLERAATYGGGNAENVAKGLEMTLRSFGEVMERLGVKEIESLGKTFDPELHNAVFHVDDESYGEQEIVEVLQKGYTIGDKVLRYAMVKVAN